MTETAPPSKSFPKDYRIAKRSDFTRIYDSGTKFFGRFVVVFAVPRSGGCSRIGITATKKIGKAHDRNRLKRWVREIFRARREELGFQNKDVEFVVNLKFSARAATFPDFERDFQKTLARTLSVRP